MNRNESKYFHTAVKMDEALLSILEKKDFSYITVKEICQTAGVNRSTFYLHYDNILDLLKETSQYILDRHFAYYNTDLEDMTRRVRRSVEQGDRGALIFITREYLTPYLTFIRENRSIFKLALKHFEIMNMQEVYRKLFRCVFEPILASFQVAERERPFVIKFYLTGVFAIVMEWLDGDCREEIDFLIKVVNDCVLGPKALHG